MDDEEDNDERNEEENQDEDHDFPFKSYKISKYFNKSNRDLKLFSLRLKYKPHLQYIRNFKFSLEAAKNNFRHHSLESFKLKVDHKTYFAGIKSNIGYTLTPFQREIGSQLKVKLKRFFEGWGSINVGGKIKKKDEGSANASYGFNLLQKALKLKLGAEAEMKKGVGSYCGVLELIYKIPFSSVSNYLPFIQKYDSILKGNFRYKSESLKTELNLRCHAVTLKEHKVHFEYKLKRESQAKIEQTLGFNVQDARSILTVNTEIKIQNKAIVNKEIKCLLEYDKLYKVGVQFKNQVPQVILERNKLGWRLLNSVKVSGTAKGLVSKLNGKLKVFESWLNYNLSFQMKRSEEGWMASLPRFAAGVDLTYNI